MLRNHYNQKARLKEFSIQEEDKFKITMIDLENKKIGRRKIDRAFYEKGLYSDELEKELNDKVEKPGMKIFDKIYHSGKRVVLMREELEMMKKYLLIQDYRNPLNISKYSPDWKVDTLHYNTIYKERCGSSEEYVYEMMHEILDHTWDELLDSKEHEVKLNTNRIHGESTLFVRTNSEFLINDAGEVSERNVKIVTGDERMMFKKLINDEMKRVSRTATEEIIDQFINTHQYFDNYTFYPISSYFGIISVDMTWTSLLRLGLPFDIIYQKYGLESQFLKDNFTFCKNIYSDPHLRNGIVTPETLEKYSSSYDHFIYPIKDLDNDYTAYLNDLMINETSKYIGFKTIDKIWPSIIMYNEFSRLYGTKKDLSWVKENMDWKSPLN